ncbi:N-acetylglucosamine-specific PTS transporter subunit IIBC [Sphingosinithalassobacter portus]|uniref:N-acetylglucosamine-specific PTS transporter subunit IIBC n=1 Tax=Stakelama portus TaxID=2676234 RepID=UPI001876DFC2|nr:N-acetylglucosamine-specific PTS transporter subunit IIBC [Sphingosinithalassobacter portus]
MKRMIEKLQPLGRALMLPIAVLPVAGLLLRLGQPDLLNIAFLSAAGDAVFSHLGLLFAVGVATGFARDGNGAACLAGVVCFLIIDNVAAGFVKVPPDALVGFSGDAIATATDAFRRTALAKIDVPIGIVSGLTGGLFYNRFSTVNLPDYLAFFGGRRLVPIISGFAGLVFGVVLGVSYGAIDSGINVLSTMIVEAGGVGLFIYGVLNRLLLVTGLHHILNNVAWFVVGDYHGTTGDLRRFFAGDPTAGNFMSGYFPIMMFGLPGACLAMYQEARTDRRKAVAGLLLSLAVTSFLTGVTEPIEFTFIFLAPALYAIHAVLTGISMALMPALGVHLGFGFSAGLFDYLLNFGKSTRPLLLIPVGLAYFAIYYGLFRVTIRRFGLATPGREEEADMVADDAPSEGRGADFLKALGGSENVDSVDACTTRLRLMIADQSKMDEPRLRALGARGILKPSAHATQVILGPIADAVAMEIRAALRNDGPTVVATSERPTSSPVDVDRLPPELVAAIGGRDAVRSVQAMHGRLRLDLTTTGGIARNALESAGARGLAIVDDHIAHILVPEAVLKSVESAS